MEEQVAGLLHDVSTLAFSHVTDWVFSKGSEGVEDLHDSIHEEFVRKTEIPKILEKFDFSIERILNEENFTLLERKIPNLCADRIDYALREFKYWLNPRITGGCVKDLVNFNGEMVFADRNIAFDFATNFLELQTRHWGGHEAVARYHLFSKTLKIALKEGLVSKEDFYGEEGMVLSKIEGSQSEEIRSILTTLRRKEIKDFEASVGKRVRKKFRYVDPKIIVGGKLVRLSRLVPSFQKTIDKHRRINRGGLVV